MSTIVEMVEHLANITFLLDYYEKLGAPKNRYVLAEFTRLNNELIAALKEQKDKADEHLKKEKQT